MIIVRYLDIEAFNEIKKIRTLQSAILNRQRLLSQAGRFLLLSLLNELFPCKDDVLQSIRYSKFGRPYIEGVSFDFNISHKEDLVVCAINTMGLIGVDIEKELPVELNEYQSVLSRNEMLDIYKSKKPLAFFYELWTKKEAIMKGEGLGFYMSVPNFADSTYHYYKSINSTWWIHTKRIKEEYTLSVASSTSENPIISEQILKHYE